MKILPQLILKVSKFGNKNYKRFFRVDIKWVGVFFWGGGRVGHVAPSDFIFPIKLKESETLKREREKKKYLCKKM